MIRSILKAILADVLKLRDKKLAATVASLIVAGATALIPGLHLTATEITAALTIVVTALAYLEKLGILKAKAARAAKRAERK